MKLEDDPGRTSSRELSLSYSQETSVQDRHRKKQTWDTALEDMAKAYAKKCIWAHNPDRGRIGENLFLTTSATLNVEQAVEDWYNEVKDYDFNANTCAENQMCGHYTQVVWASTIKVGCGAQFCEKVGEIDETNANLLVCNYSPPGNFQGRKPYTPGTSCTKCPAKSTCASNLCASTQSGSQQPGPNAAPGMQPGSIALLTVFVFLWFCLN